MTRPRVKHVGCSPSGRPEAGFNRYFSIDHPQSEIDWANQIVEVNPDTIFIIGPHRYLYDFEILGGRYGEGVVTPIGVINMQEESVPGVIEPSTAEELLRRR